MIRESSGFLFICDNKTESVSENMIEFLLLLLEMMLSARFIVKASAVNMEELFL